MCKEAGAYPKCDQCKDIEAPDSTPNVSAWEELLAKMNSLVAEKDVMSCEAQDQKRRSLLRAKLKVVGEDMCKEVVA